MAEPLTGTVCFPKAHFADDLWLCEPMSYGAAWLDLWSLANDRRRVLRIRGVDVPVERGQLAWSNEKLGERWRWGREKTRKFIQELQDLRKIMVKATNVTTIITVLDYTIYNPDTTPELPLPPTPEHAAEQTTERAPFPTPEHAAEQTQKYGSKEEGRMEGGRGEGPAVDFAELPSSAEVAEFCRAWAGDLARGIPGGIPDVWWTGWLANQMRGDRPFPSRWKRVLELAFVSDWLAGHPKAVGLGKKNAAAADATSPPARRERGEILQQQAGLRRELGILKKTAGDTTSAVPHARLAEIERELGRLQEELRPNV